MTTTTTTTNATSDTQTSTSGRLGPVAYRPGATPNTPGLMLYAVITVRGRLTIVAAAPNARPVSPVAPARAAPPRAWSVLRLSMLVSVASRAASSRRDFVGGPLV